MFFVVKSVRVCEMSIVAAKLLCLVVHHFNKAINAAFAHVIRKNNRSVVSGRNHHAVEQIDSRHCFSDMIGNICKRASCVLQIVKNLFLDRDPRGFGILYMLICNYICHNFGC